MEKYWALLDAKLVAAGLTPSGTPSDYSLLFSDSPAQPHSLQFDMSQNSDAKKGSVGDPTRTYADILATPPKGPQLGTHQPSSRVIPTNPYMGRRTEQVNKGSNVVHIFSQDHKEAWNGYDSDLDKSNEDNADSDDTPPDKEAKLAAAEEIART